MSNLDHEALFDSCNQANVVLANLNDVLNTYGYVTLSDFLDLIGEPSTWEDDQCGWTNLDGVQICKRLIDDGGLYENPTYLYSLTMPELERLTVKENNDVKGDVNMKETKVESKAVAKESFNAKLGRFIGQLGSAVFLLSLVACFAAACISLTAKFIIWLF